MKNQLVKSAYSFFIYMEIEVKQSDPLEPHRTALEWTLVVWLIKYNI